MGGSSLDLDPVGASALLEQALLLRPALFLLLLDGHGANGVPARGRRLGLSTPSADMI